jgi:hypothetical protein
MITAWDGLASRCATTWRVYARPTERNPPYNIGQSPSVIPEMEISSKRMAATPLKIPQMAN